MQSTRERGQRARPLTPFFIAAASRGVETYLRNGHGRCGCSSRLRPNPPEMVGRHIQAPLDDKLTVSNV
jgi:hypothetical protein